MIQVASNLNPSTPAASAATGAAAALLRPGEDFRDVLNRLAMKTSTAAQKTKDAQKAAGDLVANALILPVLKQIRQSPFADDNVFSGGIGEKTFGPEFDMQLADRIAHSPQMGVTQALAERLLNRGHPAPRVKMMRALYKGVTGPNGLMQTTNVNGVDIHG